MPTKEDVYDYILKCYPGCLKYVDMILFNLEKSQYIENYTIFELFESIDDIFEAFFSSGDQS